MTPNPDKILTDSADIALIEGVAAKLKNAEQVRLTLRGGEVIEGSVVERPTVQLFEDADGNQGSNGLLRLDHSDRSDRNAYVWLSDIAAVEVLRRH